MDEHEGAQPQDEDVEGHLLKETAAAAVAAGTLFAGASSAQARIIDPGPGEQAQATLTQKASSKPAKKTNKKADTHQRQRNRADTIDP
jgi:hypothetical protein